MQIFYLIKTLRDQTLRYQIKFKKLHLMITSGFFLNDLTFIFIFDKTLKTTKMKKNNLL